MHTSPISLQSNSGNLIQKARHERASKRALHAMLSHLQVRGTDQVGLLVAGDHLTGDQIQHVVVHTHVTRTGDLQRQLAFGHPLYQATRQNHDNNVHMNSCLTHNTRRPFFQSYIQTTQLLISKSASMAIHSTFINVLLLWSSYNGQASDIFRHCRSASAEPILGLTKCPYRNGKFFEERRGQ